MKKISIVLIEDNRLLRESILKIFAKQVDLKVKASFNDCATALNSIIELKPDILLSDLDIRNHNSLGFVKKLKKDLPDIKIIAMDIVPLVEGVLLFVEAEVSGFILKDAKSSEILKTIGSVSKGEKVLPANLTESLFSQIVDKAVNHSIPPEIIETIKMTNRERQIMELVAQGFANKEIAEELSLSVFTVKSHIHNLLEKLAFNTRVQIANYAHNSRKNKAVENETYE